MATQPKKPAKKSAAADARAEKQREKKEVITKLRNMGPTAQVEVVNEAISKQLNGFTDFLREQSVIGIGIGLVLGTQLKTVVDSITNGLVLPLTTLVLPNQKSLADQVLTVHVDDRVMKLEWGNIAYTLFNFVVVAAIVYSIFKLFHLDRLAKKK